MDEKNSTPLMHLFEANSPGDLALALGLFWETSLCGFASWLFRSAR
ncbi:MAG: hypothetical protein M3Y27_17600 [Acidobacteriota bacterium]|nr:hypothetical protein [Acidobacteriota bacterium]